MVWDPIKEDDPVPSQKFDQILYFICPRLLSWLLYDIILFFEITKITRKILASNDIIVILEILY